MRLYTKRNTTHSTCTRTYVVHIHTRNHHHHHNPPAASPAALHAARVQSKGEAPAKTAIGAIKKNVYRTVLDAMHVKGANNMGYGGRKKGVDRAPPPKLGEEVKLAGASKL